MRKSTSRSLQLLTLAALLAFTMLSSGSVPAQAGLPRRPQTSLVYFLPETAKKGPDLTVSDVKIIQGTTVSDAYSIQIADRATIVRVFVNTGSAETITGVTAQLCGYDEVGNSLECLDPDNGRIAAPSIEADLDSTLNFELPSNWLKPGNAYSVELDPDQLASDSNRSNNRFPASGTQSFDFTTVASLNTVIVPIEYQPYQEPQPYFPRLDDFSYLTHLSIKVFPLPEINNEIHALFRYAPNGSSDNLNNPTGQGWIRLLNEITQLHLTEAGDHPGEPIHNYYGVVNSFDAHGCPGTCITGIGWLPPAGNPYEPGYQTAVGWSGRGAGDAYAAETMIHEVGHNFDRRHVLCTGQEDSPDPGYPYAGGSIGQFGLDATSGELYPPGDFADFMSYCEPTWTSDYTYWNIHQYLDGRPMIESLPGARVDTYYVGGWISPTGEITLRPMYRQQAQLTSLSDGEYQLQLLAADGKVLAAHAFSPVEIPDGSGYSGFGFLLPAVEGVSGLRIQKNGRILFERLFQADMLELELQPPGLAIKPTQAGLALSWAQPANPDSPVVYRVRFSRDGGRTWEVLALDWPDPEFILPIDAGVDLRRARLEIQAVDGINTNTQVYRLQE